jgi:hypothetical protein
MLLLGNITFFNLAQALVRDYAITEIESNFSDDQSQFLITVTIANLGTTATSDAELIVTLLTGEQRELGRQSFAPLASGTSTTFSLVFNLDDFEPGSEQTIEVVVGRDAFEPQNTPLAQDNQRSITITIPERSLVQTNLWDNPEQFLPVLAFEGESVILFGMAMDQQQAAIVAVVAVAIVLFLWLLTVVLRLIFRRPPRFPAWQPPYAVLPMVDQNSLEGRRQGWQQYAQNSLLLAAPVPGNLHPVKLLLGEQGNNLGGWKCTALRLTQYDTYGRIMRSQAIAPRKVVKRLNNVLKKRTSSSEDILRKQLTAIANDLVKQFSKTMLRKTAFLPVAFDLRWEGKQGEVRILFELYQCQQAAWHRIDQWEPVMAVMAPSLQENFSFTIHGMVGGEKQRDFQKRLREDLIWLLLEMVRELPAPSPAVEQVRHDVFDIPDTLSGMEPMRDQP